MKLPTLWIRWCSWGRHPIGLRVTWERWSNWSPASVTHGICRSHFVDLNDADEQEAA